MSTNNPVCLRRRCCCPPPPRCVASHRSRRPLAQGGRKQINRRSIKNCHAIWHVGLYFFFFTRAYYVWGRQADGFVVSSYVLWYMSELCYMFVLSVTNVRVAVCIQCDYWVGSLAPQATSTPRLTQVSRRRKRRRRRKKKLVKLTSANAISVSAALLKGRLTDWAAAEWLKIVGHMRIITFECKL